MSDYIKREDAENIMLGSCDESALWKLRYLPSADVAEVRHGRWIKAADDGERSFMRSATNATRLLLTDGI